MGGRVSGVERKQRARAVALAPRPGAGRLGAAATAATAVAAFVVAGAGAVSAPAGAVTGPLYVAQGGTDSGSCTSPSSPCATVTYALSQVSPGSTIYVSGTVDDHVDVTTSVSPVTIEGNPAGSPAVLDGTSSGTVVTVEGGSVVTLESLSVLDGATPFALAGGVTNRGGSVTVLDSTVADNAEGGLMNSGRGSVMSIVDSTVADNNNAASNGGGISEYGGRLTLIASTVSGNTGYGGGVSVQFGTFVLGASIIDGNTGVAGTGDCNDLVPLTKDFGYSLTGDSSCRTSNNTDLVGGAELGPLAANGGPTMTMIPQPASPAAGEIPKPTSFDLVKVCPGTDQRGVARPATGTVCTIGAVEAVPGVAPAFKTRPRVTEAAGASFSVPVAASGTPPPTIGVASGSSLPTGVTLTASVKGRAMLEGSVASPGRYHFTLEATDGVSPPATQLFTLVVGP
jgi:hypothetical protein